MSKNLKRLFRILLIGIIALVFLRQVFGTSGLQWSFKNNLGVDVVCVNDELIPNFAGCGSGDTALESGWFTIPSPTAWICPQYVNAPCEVCCNTNACGSCTQMCPKPGGCMICASPYPPTNLEYRCWKCLDYITAAPCQKCLTNAPQLPLTDAPTQPPNAPTQPPAVKSCQCLELEPIEDKVNHKLSFECLVVGSENAQITDYAMTFKKPDDSLVNLESENVEPIECPSSAPPNRTCYQVKTTAIDTTEKGTYEMVVPPLIICQ